MLSIVGQPDSGWTSCKLGFNHTTSRQSNNVFKDIQRNNQKIILMFKQRYPSVKKKYDDWCFLFMTYL